ncbi:MAG TPA: alpha/beta hydrolase [Chryseolinea sp.]|nr:alpha/beta hydrolase [Chryseolinea sp.]HPM31427.1 alpha/beta hydrolase [Chryseolinea sp.]
MRVAKEIDITINGLFVSHTDDGDEKAPAIVFIHGFPLNKAMWNHQVEILRNRYRVITYDVRGYGNSEPGDEELTIDLFALDLKRLLDALNLEKVILCGFSMGGYIALRAIEKFPERFDSLILCDTQCSADTPESKDKRMKSIQAIRLGGIELYADQILSGFFFNDPVNKKSKEMIEVRRMIESSSPEVVCNTLLALADRSETCSNLEKIDIPVLILVGNEDNVTPPSAAEFMHSKISGSTLFKLGKAAHLSMMDNATDFNKNLEDFLELVTQKKL